MSKKNVYFFKITMRKSQGDSICNNDEFSSIFKDIIDKNKFDSDGVDVIDLTEDSDILHIFADYVALDDKGVFMRLCKQRIRTGLSKRDYVQNKIDDILPGTDESKNGVETDTYTYINFKFGIMGIVFRQAAPNEKAIRRFFVKYNNDYYIDLLPIPNPHSLDMLYNSDEPKIKSLELEVPVPDISYLSTVLGWSEEEIRSIVLNGNMKLSLCLKPEDNNRGSFICLDKDSRKLIDIIKSKGKRLYNRASAIGKEDKENLRKYNFFDDTFGFPIAIKDCYTSNGNVISYSAGYLLNQYKEKLINLFNENHNYFNQYVD